MNTIVSLATEPEAVLHLTYADGKTIRVDLGDLLDAGGIFAALRNSHVFAQAALGDKGRYVEWPNGADLCADALRLSGEDVMDRAI